MSIFIFHIGAASKRFGIDGDREAVPLKLEVVYNRVRCCWVLFTIKIGILKPRFCKNCLISTEAHCIHWIKRKKIDTLSCNYRKRSHNYEIRIS